MNKIWKVVFLGGWEATDVRKGTAANLLVGFKFSLVPYSCLTSSDNGKLKNILDFSQ